MCVLLQYILCIHPFRSPVAPATAVHWPNLRRRGRPRCRCAAEASRCPAMGGSYPWRPEIHGENHGKPWERCWCWCIWGNFPTNLMYWMVEAPCTSCHGHWPHRPSSVKPRNAALNALQWLVCNPFFFVLDFNIAQFLIDSGKCFSEYDQFGGVWGSMWTLGGVPCMEEHMQWNALDDQKNGEIPCLFLKAVERTSSSSQGDTCSVSKHERRSTPTLREQTTIVICKTWVAKNGEAMVNFPDG